MEQPQAMLGPDYSLDCFKQTMTMALFTDALGLGLRNDIRLNRFLNLEIDFLRVRNFIYIRIKGTYPISHVTLLWYRAIKTISMTKHLTP